MKRASFIEIILVIFFCSFFFLGFLGPVGKWLGMGKGEAEKAYKEGIQLYEQGKFQEALKKFEEAIYWDEKYTNAYYEAGKTCIKLEKYGKAKEYLKKAESLGLQTCELYRDLGFCMLQEEDMGALTYFQKALEKDSMCPRVYLYIAIYGIKFGEEALKGLNLSSIEEALDKELQISATPEVYYYKGILHMKKKEYLKAVKNFEKLEKEATYSNEIPLLLSIAYCNLKDYDKALEYIETYLKENSSDPRALYTKAVILDYKKRNKEAIDTYNEFINVAKDISEYTNKIKVAKLRILQLSQ